jgi:hypothetical protein
MPVMSGRVPAGMRSAERKTARVGATLMAVIATFFVLVVIGIVLLFAL